MLLFNFSHHCLESEPGHEMIGSWNRVNKAQTVQIWLIVPNRDTGMAWSNMWKFFILLMALSTCILSAAILWVWNTSMSVICPYFPRNGGIFSRTRFSSNKSWISNPLSAIKLSPSLKGRSKNPLLMVISLIYYHGTIG